MTPPSSSLLPLPVLPLLPSICLPIIPFPSLQYLSTSSPSPVTFPSLTPFLSPLFTFLSFPSTFFLTYPLFSPSPLPFPSFFPLFSLSIYLPIIPFRFLPYLSTSSSFPLSPSFLTSLTSICPLILPFSFLPIHFLPISSYLSFLTFPAHSLLFSSFPFSRTSSFSPPSPSPPPPIFFQVPITISLSSMAPLFPNRI